MAGPSAGQGAAQAKVYTGPSVRVTRGKETTEESVSAKTGAVLSGQASGVRRAGQALPAAGATIAF
jgi:pilus assembly protein CpaB